MECLHFCGGGNGADDVGVSVVRGVVDVGFQWSVFLVGVGKRETRRLSLQNCGNTCPASRVRGAGFLMFVGGDPTTTMANRTSVQQAGYVGVASNTARFHRCRFR